MSPNSLHPGPAVSGDRPEDIARDVAAVGQIKAIPTLLRVLCRITGMRFAGVTRVTENTWIACAIRDDLGLGLLPGSQLDVEKTLCIESKRSGQPVVIAHASRDIRYCNSPKVYQIESYVSVPIVLNNGRYFGNLYAVDPAPAAVTDPKILDMFTSFASLIASQLEIYVAQEEDRTALRDERETSELRDQFIAILGHDLRNPLQAVSASGELLERRLTDPKLISIASRIRSNVRRMTSLIDDVLDFARGRVGGGIGVQIDAIDNIDSCLHAVVREFQDSQPDRQILAHIEVGRIVHCDLGRIQQIASNLIGNALTHGALDTAVKVTAYSDEKHFILEVWNSGEPIPDESIDKIFEPFWRHSTAGNRQGLGLGLHICSQIVRAHGGKISATSTRELGTQFSVRLPLQAAGA